MSAGRPRRAKPTAPAGLCWWGQWGHHSPLALHTQEHGHLPRAGANAAAAGPDSVGVCAVSLPLVIRRVPGALGGSVLRTEPGGAGLGAAAVSTGRPEWAAQPASSHVADLGSVEAARGLGSPRACVVCLLVNRQRADPGPPQPLTVSCFSPTCRSTRVGTPSSQRVGGSGPRKAASHPPAAARCSGLCRSSGGSRREPPRPGCAECGGQKPVRPVTRAQVARPSPCTCSAHGTVIANFLTSGGQGPAVAVPRVTGVRL